jgi:hypothetical protein
MSRAGRRRTPAPVPRKRGTPPPRSRLIRAVVAAVVIGVLAAGMVLLRSDRGSGRTTSQPSVPLAPLASLGVLRPPPAPGPLGPEHVPIPAAPVLAPASAPGLRRKVDGISDAAGEQLAFHIHAHLTVFVRGAPRQIPRGIGVVPPLELVATPVGPFVVAGSAFFWLHTHAADGIIHTESPIVRTYTLGNFFDLWKPPLGRDRVGPARGYVTAFFDGRRYLGNPRRIPLLAHAQIQLDVGRPLIAPESIRFPPGL